MFTYITTSDHRTITGYWLPCHNPFITSSNPSLTVSNTLLLAVYGAPATSSSSSVALP
ncbi:hypothetical protein OIU76_026139 [Salix suchowensis]|uniref:Uncharacterized protein n=1 Tax=Salix suchowensis TaxID=1278906 RepID=A0ABQ9AED5_9ROSI|nr:hypothetical protein OIU77_009459 [Salix suchowensis]KAJ6377108.1 hypothetical protein OIU76_026139 [Salix suchowensis]